MEKTICVFGDSITWGAGDPENGGWVARLRRYFETNYHNILVYNNGVPGDTTDELLARFKVECVEQEPQIIICAIGINDSQYIKSQGVKGVSLEKFQNNLVELITQAKSFSDKIILVGLTKVDLPSFPSSWGIENFYDNDNIAKYNVLVEKISLEHEIPFIDLFHLLGVEDLDDGLHPNSKGHEKMFLRIKEFLQINKIM